MKIAIECRSPLLQKSLENFLEGHLCSPHSCDLLLSDEQLLGRENLLRIGSDNQADIIKPFSKSQLFIKLEQFYKMKEEANVAMSIVNEIENSIPAPEGESELGLMDLSSLEEKIERLTASYVHGVMSLVKEYHGHQ